jgi:hypothetical protein
LDKTGEIVALSIFNVKPQTIQVSDFVTIVNPTLKILQGNRLVRVDDPRHCLLNDNQIGIDHLLAVGMAIESSFLLIS